MTDNEIFEAYEQLWLKLKDDHKDVHVVVRYDFKRNNEPAWFDATENKHGWPTISINRESYPTPATKPSRHRTDGVAVDIKAELINLAHEAGHFDSWRAERGLYETAIVKYNTDRASMTADERRVVLDEEEEAAKRGRRKVPDALRAEFDRRQDESLSRYESALGIRRGTRWTEP